MSDKNIYILNFLVILGTGMMAGVFLAFSTFIMAALARVSPPSGISAMQMININVINPIFMLVLFGTAILCLVFVYVSMRHGFSAQVIRLIIGSAFYIFGVIGITMFANVPLNDALRGINPLSAASSEFWPRYLQSWTFWNHVRCIAAIVSCTAFISVISRV
jgi:uncharacterized membrane protein